jgi:hypothetical protein
MAKHPAWEGSGARETRYGRLFPAGNLLNHRDLALQTSATRETNRCLHSLRSRGLT